MNRQKLFGITMAVISAAAYGTNPLFTLPAYSRHSELSAASVLLFRYGIAAMLMALLVIVRRKNFRISGHNLLLIAVNGCLVGLNSLALFASYRIMDSGIASTILFVYPLMVAAIMTGIYHEKLSLFTILCILASLGGVFLLSCNGGSLQDINLQGVILVLVSALFYACYIVAIKTTTLAQMESEPLTFYCLLFASLSFLAIIKGGGTNLFIPNDTLTWSCLVGLGLIPGCLSFVTMSKAVPIIGPTQTAIFGALEPVTAIVIGFSLFGEKLTPLRIFGILIVLCSVLAVINEKQLFAAWKRLRGKIA